MKKSHLFRRTFTNFQNSTEVKKITVLLGKKNAYKGADTVNSLIYLNCLN